ncbi:MAG: peroxidase-related enzyme [Anaerolineae bacterium]|nr:peroxidase-related enzyme [Anaerolineae bacterium]
MSYISTVPVDEAEGDVQAMYADNDAKMGYVPNYVKLFSHRPQVIGAWGNLLGSIRSNLDLRRYELATIAAARGLRSSYCMMAHSSVLLKNDFSSEQLTAIATDYTEADLQPVDVAIMAFAEKIARDASSITEADIQAMRDCGMTDTEIFDVAATAAARCFFSKLLDSLGAQPDSVFMSLDDTLRQCLTVGREVSQEAVEHAK